MCAGNKITGGGELVLKAGYSRPGQIHPLELTLKTDSSAPSALDHGHRMSGRENG